MNNGMMMLIVGLGLLWLMGGRKTTAPGTDSLTGNPWIGGSQAAQQTAAYEVGF